MKAMQNTELFLSAIIFIPLFLILVSISAPLQDEILCSDGIITLSVENRALESITRELSNKCNIQIFLDQNARNILINANFKGYPTEYAISKILEGTQLNFIIYQNKLAKLPYTVYIGPTKGPGEQSSYIEIDSNSRKENYSNPSYNQNISTHQPPPYKSSQTPNQTKQPATFTSNPISIPTAGGFINTPAQNLNQPPASYDIHKSPPQPNSGTPDKPLPTKRPTPDYERRQPPPNYPKREPTNQNQQPQSPPPNTGSG